MHMMEYYLAIKRDGLLIQRNNIQESQNNYAERSQAPQQPPSKNEFMLPGLLYIKY